MSYITWIIIILIVISIVVTVTEVGLRFGMLSRDKAKGEVVGDILGGGDGRSRLDLRRLIESNVSVEELRAWSKVLGERERAAVCGGEFVGTTFAGV
jgi:hypothetical protein